MMAAWKITAVDAAAGTVTVEVSITGPLTAREAATAGKGVYTKRMMAPLGGLPAIPDDDPALAVPAMSPEEAVTAHIDGWLAQYLVDREAELALEQAAPKLVGLSG